MKKFLMLFACLALVGSAHATEPIAFIQGAGGGPAGTVLDDEICWLQVYDVDGSRQTSEIIGSLDLESWLANDFYIFCDVGLVLTKVIWWGGPYNWLPGDPEILDFNVYFYSGDQCLPEGEFASYLHTTPTRIDLGFGAHGLPMYQYALDIYVPIPAYTRLWVTCQADDHIFPPQWGWETAAYLIECESMFHSVYFGCPDWVPYSILFGTPSDNAFAFECTCPVAADETTWGAVKALFQ